MNINEFVQHLASLDQITSDQFWLLKKTMNKLDIRKIVTLILEDGDKVACGHCGSEFFYKNGRVNDLQRYKCKKCNKSFNQLTGTPLARLKKKGRWLNYSYCLSQGFSVRKAATEVGVSKRTSFKWRHRFLKNAHKLYAPTLNGIVETKETSFKYSEKGGAIPIDRPRRFGEQVYVYTSLDRDRLVSTPIIDKFELNSVLEHFKTKIAKDSIYISEGKDVVLDYVNEKKLFHQQVTNSENEQVYLHTDNVVGYNSELKGWMVRFRGVSTKYLHNYLSWFRELDEFFMRIPMKVLLVRAKTIKRFPYNPILKTE
jgi:transposase-like protein